MFRKLLQNTRKPAGLGGKLRLWGMNRFHAPLAAWGSSHLPLKSDARILDIGCGGGANIARFLRDCPAGRVCGMDYARESVAHSRKKNAAVVRGHDEAAWEPFFTVKKTSAPRHALEKEQPERAAGVQSTDSGPSAGRRASTSLSAGRKSMVRASAGVTQRSSWPSRERGWPVNAVTWKKWRRTRTARSV